MLTIASHSPLNTSEYVRVEAWFQKNHQQEMAYGESNGHVTDGVTWPLKVNIMSLIYLGPNISKTAGDAIYQHTR